MMELKTYSGVIHIHTRCSDGSGELKEIIAAGESAALDYLVITDHNTLRYYEEDREGWYGSLLVMVGEEITHRKGHCLALNISKSVAKNKANAQAYLTAIAQQGGLSFIAHPHQGNSLLFKIKRWSWQNWQLNSFNGIEIWSFLNNWVARLNLPNLIAHCRYPERFITAPLKATLKKWDELCQQRPVVGIGGVDGHARVVVPFGLVKLFPYERLFNTLRTYVISPPLPEQNFYEARRIFYQALAQGHCYVANASLRNACGFAFYATSPAGKTLLQGDSAVYSADYQLFADLPLKAELRLLHNGKPILKQNTHQFSFTPPAPGVYRLEIYLEGRPWIFSNPIYLRKEGCKD